MDATDGLGWLKRRTVRYVLAAVLVLEAVVVVLIIAYASDSRRQNHAQTSFNPAPLVAWRVNRAQPVFRPPILKATEAKMRPDERVIGVEAGGIARAYRLAAFDDASGHLVNDLIGGVPVSVAYSNLSDCVRVYTDPEGSVPLDAEVTGLYNDEMIVKLRGSSYFHQSGEPVEPGKNPLPVPYRLLTPTRTTWKEWTQQHPATGVYVGGR